MNGCVCVWESIVCEWGRMYKGEHEWEKGCARECVGGRERENFM